MASDETADRATEAPYPKPFSDRRGRDSNPVVRGLRWRWFTATAVGAILLWGAWRGLVAPAGNPIALRWTAGAGAVLAAQSIVVRRHLDDNRIAPDAPLLPRLGPANGLTLLRGALLAAIGGFAVAPVAASFLPCVPAILYSVAVVVDVADGAVARRVAVPTVLGERLDLEFDALGILVGAILGVRLGVLPPWYLAAGLARYAFAGGRALRRVLGLPVYELPPRRGRRYLAALQMVVIATALAPPLDPPLTWTVATVAMAPFLVGFLRDWFLATGRIEAAV